MSTKVYFLCAIKETLAEGLWIWVTPSPQTPALVWGLCSPGSQDGHQRVHERHHQGRTPCAPGRKTQAGVLKKIRPGPFTRCPYLGWSSGIVEGLS